MLNYNALIRQKILEKLSDDEKALLISSSKSDSQHREVMQALQTIDGKLKNGRSAFIKDFGANVLGNYFADFTIYLGAQLLKHLK